MSRLPSVPSEMSQWSIQMWWPPRTDTASLPDEQPTDASYAGSRAQLPAPYPTILMLRRMTLTEPFISTVPCSSAPQSPAMVLFEPMVNLPVRVPVTLMTRGSVPAAWLLKAATVVTTIGAKAVASAPVVPLTPLELTDAHPTSASRAGGDEQEPGIPMVPPVTVTVATP